jgi:glycogen debranching enzyme
MWNPQRKFYFDLTVGGQQSQVKTVAAYWTLLSGVATAQQADALAAELTNPKTFGRMHRVPTCPADQEGFKPTGGYWRGAVWAPINTMVIRGLQRYGKHDLARQIARDDLRIVAEVFKRTGTVWENYAPDAAQPGDRAKPDFVGWTGIVPILYFLEFGIGLRPDAPKNELTWTITSDQRCGCQRFRFNGHTVSLVAAPDTPENGKLCVSVQSDGPFRLRVERHGEQSDFAVQTGQNSFTVR